MLALGSDCRYRFISKEVNCRDHNKSFAGSSKLLSVSKWQVTSHIWQQALSQNPTLILVHVWSTLYCVYHFHPFLFPTLHTCLTQFWEAYNITFTKMSEKQMLLESFFEKGERPNDETAEDCKTANKMKVAFKRKYQKSYLNYRSIAIGGSYSPTHFA